MFFDSFVCVLSIDYRCQGVANCLSSSSSLGSNQQSNPLRHKSCPFCRATLFRWAGKKRKPGAAQQSPPTPPNLLLRLLADCLIHLFFLSRDREKKVLLDIRSAKVPVQKSFIAVNIKEIIKKQKVRMPKTENSPHTKEKKRKNSPSRFGAHSVNVNPFRLF